MNVIKTEMSSSTGTTIAASAMTSTSNNVDMSTKVGGRIFYPALPVVDSSYPKSDIDIGFQNTFQQYCSTNIPLENKNGIQLRERVLNSLRYICNEWITYVARNNTKLSKDVIDNAVGQLFTSGSYRLGIHEPGADIDTILVVPNYVKRSDFFGTTNTATDDNQTLHHRDPNSLAERIRNHPDVTNFIPVEGAAVPLLTFDWHGINLDLLFARVNTNIISETDFDIDNDIVLDGVDSATEKSLNGPRVTNLIASIVSGTPERYQTFLTVVRCVRKWAKNRGLYSNKMGYWGGVNINIGVALAIQLYPNYNPAMLLRKFFLIFKTWRYPQPIMLTKPHDAGYGLPVWNPLSQTNTKSATAVAPMITPAYPAMNSTLSVSRQTLQILQEEFTRAHTIIDTLWKEYNTKFHNALLHQRQDDNNKATLSSIDIDWSRLFEPSDFFISYPQYLSLCIVGPTQADAQSWAGFVESRLRKLVSDLLSRSLPIKKIQLWPKKIEACVADKNALLTSAQRQNCITYFIGFQIDQIRMRGTQLNIEIPLQNFREWDLSRYQPYVNGMDILVKSFHCKTLPKICFDTIYPGGKLEAMKKRRQMRDSDPIRQEKKHMKRLEELKAKMAEIRKKKEEQLLLQNKVKDDDTIQGEVKGEGDVKAEEEVEGDDSKRKREDLDNVKNESDSDDDGNVKKVKLEDIAADEKVKDEDDVGDDVVKEETNLLENAFDTYQEGDEAVVEIKTREEAEMERQKLLAGELNDIDPVSNDQIAYETDDDENAAMDYVMGEGVGRQIYYNKNRNPLEQQNDTAIMNENNATNITVNKVEDFLEDSVDQKRIERKDPRSLPIAKEWVEELAKYNFHFVSDDESKVIGSNMIPPWKHIVSGDENKNDDTASNNKKPQRKPMIKGIKFLKKFDVVELDAYGYVIDKGDDDFMPSKSWIGQKVGFEFKLGLRGLGYYRTGKEVIIPSNTAY